MADLVVKQHDTFPPLVATLVSIVGPVDLGSADHVTFIAAPNDTGLPTIEGLCDITDAPNGEVTYNWATDDTLNIGTYRVEFEVVWTAGGIQTFPSDGYKELDIVADLG